MGRVRVRVIGLGLGLGLGLLCNWAQLFGSLPMPTDN